MFRLATVPRVVQRTNCTKFVNQVRFTATKKLSESFINGTSCTAIEDLYDQWKADKNSVDKSWAEYFEAVELGKPHGEAIKTPKRVSKYAEASSASFSEWNASDSLKIFKLIRSYRVLGHFMATLDPLGLEKASFCRVKEEYKKELHPSSYGFTDADMDRQFFVGEELSGGKPVRSLHEIIHHLQKVYCGNIGIQYMHIHDPAVKDWLQTQFEASSHFKTTAEKKKEIFKELLEAEEFELFCQNKFSVKRFGLNGGESLIPGMHALLKSAASHDIQNIVLGMPHRGRLNVMANILGKPLIQLFNEFQIDSADGKALASTVLGSGDVKYHLGTSHDRVIDGKKIHLSLAANPSHLEAVNPVVCGKTRAKQTNKNGTIDYNKALSVLIHGDAAFAGQGVVPETIELGGLGDFTTGGSIHIIVNNQIGFTTVPKYARTSPYASEVAKAAGCPIFHVNGDHPELVAAVFKLAVDFRQKFYRDAVIDIYCYRRHGHNEFDQPRYTQPKMYQKIDEHPTVATIYQKKLIKEGVITEEEAKKTNSEVNAVFQAGFAARSEYKSVTLDWLECHWKGFVSMKETGHIENTGVSKDTIRKILTALITIPKDFELHPTLAKFRFAAIQQMLNSEKGFTWAIGEALALGSLLLEQKEVRLSGQDCERGTFSQRHAVYYCQKTEKTYEPLEHLSSDQGIFNVINSSLSENAVLGFELGYALENPNALVLWEAQFGDFANGAQVIIDQFISSGEQKWLRMAGLTMLLPHGFEGQGPEHSSARLERFLQLCDDDPVTIPSNIDEQARQINLQVANCTTPANFFHLLRRQMHRNYRKPLVVMTPKSLLTKEECTSAIDDFGPSSSFHRIYADNNPDLVNPEKVTRVLFCTGKVYYDLAKRRQDTKRNDIAIVRIEQIAPFPFDLVKVQLDLYQNAEAVWVQEEPLNQGAWTYVAPRIETAGRRPRYVGRNPSAAPATGLAPRHRNELETFLSESFA